MTREERLEGALAAILDAVDYSRGACLVTEMVGAVLPAVLIVNARDALSKTGVDRTNIYVCVDCHKSVAEHMRLPIHSPLPSGKDPDRMIYKCPYCRGRLEPAKS